MVFWPMACSQYVRLEFGNLVSFLSGLLWSSVCRIYRFELCRAAILPSVTSYTRMFEFTLPYLQILQESQKDQAGPSSDILLKQERHSVGLISMNAGASKFIAQTKENQKKGAKSYERARGRNVQC